MFVIVLYLSELLMLFSMCDGTFCSYYQVTEHAEVFSSSLATAYSRGISILRCDIAHLYLMEWVEMHTRELEVFLEIEINPSSVCRLSMLTSDVCSCAQNSREDSTKDSSTMIVETTTDYIHI